MERPVSCFITFDSEQGKYRADNYEEYVKKPEWKMYRDFLGQRLELKQASEPSDIIWEN